MDIKQICIALYKALYGDWTYHLRMQKKGERENLLPHYEKNDNEATVSSAVVYVNNGWTWHAGLCDRLRAIVTVYDWCERHGRDFKIYFAHPFMLQDYLTPNQYNWLMEGKDISYDLRYSVPMQMIYGTSVERLRLNGKLYPLVEQWMDRRFLNENRQIHLYTNLFTDKTFEFFSEKFHELFRPVPRLQTLIDEHLANIGGKYISISFRFTTLLGDFTDCTGTPLPPEERADLIERSLEAISAISQQAPAHDRILVTADSETFLSKAKQMNNVYVIPGKVGHIDYDHGDDVNMKTFLDFFLISKAEKVYLARSGKMYRSAFAKTAALVNDKPFEVYEF